MEECLKLLEEFLHILGSYRDASDRDDTWYETMKKKLLSDQDTARLANQENRIKQQENLKKLKEKSASDRDQAGKQIREQIKKKQEILAENIRENERIRDEILKKKENIVRPEFFRYAYRYKEFGDFHPEIRRPEDFAGIDLDEMVERVNDGKTALWVNELKALLKSEDMLLEYAELANLFSKARYLCEVDNDILRETAQQEIRQLEQKLREEEEQFMDAAAMMMKKQQRITQDNKELTDMFEKNCLEEAAHLREEYQNRQAASFAGMKQELQEKCGSERMKEVYRLLENAKHDNSGYICEDGIPLNAKLGKLWFFGAEDVKNDYIRQVVEQEYPFMLEDGRFCIPGVD